LKNSAEYQKFKPKSYPTNLIVHQEAKDLEALGDQISNVAQADQSYLENTLDRIRLEEKLGELKIIAADDRARILGKVDTQVLFDDQGKRLVFAPLRPQDVGDFRGNEQTMAVVDLIWILAASKIAVQVSPARCTD